MFFRTCLFGLLTYDYLKGSTCITPHQLCFLLLLQMFLFYTGLNDRGNEGEFQWADGSEAVKQEFRWYPDEPKDSTPGEDCVEMYVRSHQYLWNDAPCGDNLHFVCQVCDIFCVKAYLFLTCYT